MMKPIYQPKGLAEEYAEWAMNIYTGCTHECFYCFAPRVLHKEVQAFKTNVAPRADLVEHLRKQIISEKITGRTIHLCFTCDPYPSGVDTSITREVIMLLKEFGNHVQLLTKNCCTRDLDLLDENDWYGITLTGATPDQEPYAALPFSRIIALIAAKERGIKTWVSFEPVIDAHNITDYIISYGKYFDLVKIGKLNYYPSKINWKNFGNFIEQLCKDYGIECVIKSSLRAEM